MNKCFYLSLVYDINGYDRLDLVKNNSLKKIDEIIGEFNNANEVKEAYLKQYNINKKGRICLLFEDLDQKKKELMEYNMANEEDLERIKKSFSYVHMIPIKYKNRKLLDFNSCIRLIKKNLHNPKKQISVFKNNKEEVKSNKMYLFETEEEQDLITKESKYHDAIDMFIKRLKKSNEETRYFYCRSLMKICNLSYVVTKIKYGKLVIYDNDEHKKKKTLTKTEILEEESKNIDDLYTYHDLDEIIKYSPDELRPIGSERGKKK